MSVTSQKKKRRKRVYRNVYFLEVTEAPKERVQNKNTTHFARICTVFTVCSVVSDANMCPTTGRGKVIICAYGDTGGLAVTSVCQPAVRIFLGQIELCGWFCTTKSLAAFAQGQLNRKLKRALVL